MDVTSMKRIHIIYSGIGLIIVVGLFILISALIRNNQPTVEALDFCEKYPEALFCTDDNASEQEVVTDMFSTLLETYPLGYTEGFCYAYFAGNLSVYCRESKDIILKDTVK